LLSFKRENDKSHRRIGIHPHHLDNLKLHNRVSPTRSNEGRNISKSEVTKTELPGG
jgi:hypothetical protein